jgi:hypothetical protein
MSGTGSINYDMSAVQHILSHHRRSHKNHVQISKQTGPSLRVRQKGLISSSTWIDKL